MESIKFNDSMESMDFRGINGLSWNPLTPMVSMGFHGNDTIPWNLRTSHKTWNSMELFHGVP